MRRLFFSGVALAALLLSACKEDGPKVPRVSAVSVAAETIVRNHLKAPSTAKFPGMPDFYWNEHSRTAHVSGNVEAQNVFGTMLRQRYSLRMRPVFCQDYNSDECWAVDALTIGDQQIVNAGARK